MTSQDYDSINYSWDWPFLLAFVRQQNIRYSLQGLGSLRTMIDHNLVKIQSKGKFEIAEPFKQLPYI